MNETKALRSYEPEHARVKIHGLDEFDAMRKAGKLAAEVLDFITPYVKENVTTLELDQLCHNYIVSKGAIPDSTLWSFGGSSLYIIERSL